MNKTWAEMDAKQGSHSKRTLIGTIVVFALIIVIALFNVLRSFWEYEEGNIEYSKVEKDYVNVMAIPEAKPSAKAKDDDTEEAEEEAEEESIWTEDQSIPNLSVDNDALLALNPDYFCWLYVAPTGISYPVVKGEDNDYYLHHTFGKEKNVNGCVYMDCLAWPDMMDYNIFIYGHNMRNGSMFGSMKLMLNDPEVALADPYFYLFRENAVRKYHIYSIRIASPRSDTFHNPASESEYREYIDNAIKESVTDMGVSVSTEDKTVTLSTCSGTGAGKKRLVVHGKLVGIINTDNPDKVSYNAVKKLEDGT